ncbi:asparaginyl-tRNA synthetase [Nematocida parisii]|uniref:asparagine--tRNA ligase n=1 Tax=Nematocida parisii (strain ERTm3) TaxID=935791 RepID=I3EE00_NEMP3|nr:asparaginyl-tRNA synthetase [Nematocida parisii ERTm1]EIJ87447.1 asparaginyl-tRNA synthetase [Nematocida parisii ERTm3]EIJ94527.1 asparaginyl-tRNA synthetase [Nematocida parisii ERTm1]KAI5142726.1 asparaginyl-tRNA synthetase [Nematocida parisii]KAI5152915.1 asparaginyl-tRNA synthetase [Nematocida parisii]|eukprot:XP_013057883.1 asparaginyl-tRNA synthetase [Nematocida parisii ERTm1]
MASSEDKVSEPPIKKVQEMDINQKIDYEIKDITSDLIGKTVKFHGWVRNFHQVGKKAFFTVYSAGYTAKCIYTNNDKKIHLTKHTTVIITGQVKNNYTKDTFPCEVHVTSCEVFNGKVAPHLEVDKDQTSESFLLDHQHILIRDSEKAAVLKVRAELLKITRTFYDKNEYTEITPPTLVQTQVEGGSTLFKLDYFGEDAFLTQSSQLYLETAVPVFGRAYCIASSYRAEKSNTRRHLSEYTHVEAELAWIEFNDLLSEIEDLVIFLTEGFNTRCIPILAHFGVKVSAVPVPSKPFKRVQHSEAIDILRKHNIKREDGQAYTYTDDIPDAPERYLCDVVGSGSPVFLTKFPVEMKSFYMERVEGGLTNSCDLLYPGVGEVVGGSMRLFDYDDLLAGFKREGISPEPYKFYTDQALYGPFPHGGYGLGFERILMGFMPEIVSKVRYACLYPRFNGRCRP